MAGRAGSLRAAGAYFRSSNPALARPPFGDGERISPLTQELPIMATHVPACTRLHTPHRTLKLFPSLALYRALRPVAGPVLAWRVAFAWGAAS